jgi:hypothetical protein
MNVRGPWAVWFAGVACLALLAGLAGCGKGSGFKVAPVKGKITHQGQPVKGGSITFTPIAGGGDAKGGNLGKPSTAQVNDDGTFVLSTYGTNDGAVLGKHRITYMPIFIAPKDYDDKPPPPPYVGLVPSPSEVEVKPGSNDISLELVAPAAGAKVAPGAGLIPPAKL